MASSPHALFVAPLPVRAAAPCPHQAARLRPASPTAPVVSAPRLRRRPHLSAAAPLDNASPSAGPEAESDVIALEPSVPLPSPPSLPSSLAGTTLYYTIPAVAPHHAASEPVAHHNDNDPLLLAVSFPAPSSTDAEASPPAWARARFVRTRPFFVEKRLQRRVFRGLYGTPGATGLDAPTKPKASCGVGLAVWAPPEKRPVLLAFGPRALPHAVRVDTLVTRGVTALGNVLSDSDELADVRGSELALPPLPLPGPDDRTLMLSMSRAPAGRPMYFFPVELDADCAVARRLPRLPVPRGQTPVAAVADSQLIVLALQTAREERGGGLLSSVLGSGKAKPSPRIDVAAGATLLVIDRATGASASTRLPGVVVTHLLALAPDRSDPAGSGVIVRAVGMRPNKDAVVRLSTLADARATVLWRESGQPQTPSSGLLDVPVAVVRRSERSLSIACKGVRPVGQGVAREICDAALQSDSACGGDGVALTVYDCAARRAGLVVRRAKTAGMDDGGGGDDGEEGEQDCAWLCDDAAEQLSGPAFSADGGYVSVLATCDGDADGARVLVFRGDDVGSGPVAEVALGRDRFGAVGACVAAVWAQHAAEWSDESAKAVLSAYEIFESRKWNDIDSGFSSLGI